MNINTNLMILSPFENHFFDQILQNDESLKKCIIKGLKPEVKKLKKKSKNSNSHKMRVLAERMTALCRKLEKSAKASPRQITVQIPNHANPSAANETNDRQKLKERLKILQLTQASLSNVSILRQEKASLAKGCPECDVRASEIDGEIANIISNAKKVVQVKEAE